MLSRLIAQVEDQLHRLEQGAPSSAKSDINKATNLVKDANKSKLVRLMLTVLEAQFTLSGVNLP